MTEHNDDSVPLDSQPPSVRFCVCEHHANDHNANVVMQVDQPWGEWALLLAACSSCDCPRFDPKAGLRPAPPTNASYMAGES